MNESDHELEVLVDRTPAPEVAASPNDLYDVIVNNRESLLDAALDQATEDDLKKPTDGHRKLLTVACLLPNLPTSTFRKLFDYVTRRFDHLDFSEEDWYYWEPIHFAAYQADTEKLRCLVEVLSEQKRNALSVLSENALHVLLDYGRKIEPFNVQLSNGWESRVCHVIAEEREEVVECARLLIEAGIDINHNNIWNETPLIIAIRYRLMGVIRLLLAVPNIDLDTCKDPHNQKSARDLLRENEIPFDPPNTATVSPVKTLFTYIKSREEDMFLRYKNENIRQYANETDGASGTMLQLCLVKGYIDYDKERAKDEHQQDDDILKTSMLAFFCRSGFGRSVEHLLNNGAQIRTSTRMFKRQNVFQMAVKLSYYPFLAILLEHRSNQIGEYDILEALKNTNRESFESRDCNIRHVLFLLFSKLEMSYERSRSEQNDADSRKVLNGVLDLYLTYNNAADEYRENICQVLRLGASLTGRVGNSEDKQLERISYDTLRCHLDECISPNNDFFYDSLILDEKGKYSETQTLQYLTHDSKKTDLLNHPILVYLIHEKWQKSSKFFYMNLALYSFFLLVLYVYMVLTQLSTTDKENADSFRFTLPLLKLVLWVLISVLALKELVQLYMYFPRYFCDISNYPEVAVIICCVFNLFIKEEITMIASILLSTLTFLLLLGQSPKFTKYMIIFSSTKYFLEYAVFYSIQFVAFALCFYILLPPEKSEDSNAFGEIMIKLFETLIFFIGQYDGPITDPPNFPILGRTIAAIFIFCMTIILNNLLVGLIVTDMDMIQKTSKQQRQVKMIRYIHRIEKFMGGRKGGKTLFGNMKVFEEGRRKIMRNVTHTSKVFDEDDRAYLKEIHDNRLQRKNMLSTLYEYIVSEIYSERRGVRDNRDILLKLARLEEQLRRGRPR